MVPHMFDSGLEPRDFAFLVLKNIDYDSQLRAIRELLNVHQQIARTRSLKIAEIEEEIPKRHGIDRINAEHDRTDLCHESVYEDAAHSMAAIGMLAPFIETVFSQVFESIKQKYEGKVLPAPDHSRWTAEEAKRWNCRWYYSKTTGAMENDVTQGILELSCVTGLNSYLPTELRPILKALFGYRNNMLHNGFEWPLDARNKFHKRTKQEWPEEWFSWARSGDAPWVCYMTDALINESLVYIDQILSGIGHFVTEKLEG